MSCYFWPLRIIESYIYCAYKSAFPWCTSQIVWNVLLGLQCSLHHAVQFIPAASAIVCFHKSFKLPEYECWEDRLYFHVKITVSSVPACGRKCLVWRWALYLHMCLWLQKKKKNCRKTRENIRFILLLEGNDDSLPYNKESSYVLACASLLKWGSVYFSYNI